MILGKLVIGIVADASSVPRDLAPIGRQLASLETQAASASSALGSVTAPSIGGQSGDRSTEAADSLRAALTPVLAIGDRIAVMLDRTGGTVVTLARRIDDAMKTPLTLRALEALQAKFEGTWIAAAAGAATTAAKIRSYLGSIGDVARRDLTQVTRLNFGSSLTNLTGVRQATAAIAPAARLAGGAVRSLGREIAVATGVFGAAYGVVSFFKNAISGASNLNETVSKTGVIFGESAGVVTSQADRMAKAFGSNKRETLEAASNFGIMAKAAGFSEQAAADLANRLVTLAADAASINNTSLDEALQKIRSGLAGEAEPLRTFGVMLTEAGVKAEAARLGIARLGADLTESQKITARASLIQQQLGYASGDLARTLSGPANQFRSLAGTIANLAASIGGALMPIVQPATMALSRLASLAADAFEEAKPRVEQFARDALPIVVEGIAKAADAVDFLGRNLAYAWPAIQEGFETVKNLAASAANAVLSVARYALDAAQALAQMGLTAARSFDALTGTNLAEKLEYLPKQIAALANQISSAWQHAAPGEALGDKIRGFFADLAQGAQTSANQASNALAGIGSGPAAPEQPKEIAALETKLRSEITGLRAPSGIEDDIAKLKTTKGYEDPQFNEVRSLQKQLDLAKGRIEVEKELNSLARDAIANTMTAQERYDARINELKTLYDSKKIDAETFNRSSAMSWRETLGQGTNRFAGAAQAGSREAYQAVLSDYARRNEDPARVTAKNSDVQVTEAKKQTSTLQRIVELLAGRTNPEAEIFALSP